VKQSRWSPADLDRQRRVVRRIALCADLDLRHLGAARVRLVADVRATVGTPLALFGCVVVGIVVERAASTERRADSLPRPARWLMRAAALLKALALSAPAYGALFRSAVTSPPTHSEDARHDAVR
jgi:hypothetical protein